MRKHIQHKLYRLLAAALGFLTLLPCGTVRAASDAELRLEAHRALPAQSNEIPNWPEGPVIGAESAILIEAQTGTILYSKNIHQKQFPASTTKILTALIATEQCEMDEVVTFSHHPLFDTPKNNNHKAMNPTKKQTKKYH